jgi:hypothetical protein
MVSLDLAVLSEQSVRPERAISRWPIRAASLRVLSDLGLSDAKIADYFRVGTEQVTCLRSFHQIREGRWKA